MAKGNPEVIVRTYDLGGFGDIAGAMRVASHMQKRGMRTKIKAFSSSSLEKLKILNPDVDYDNGDTTHKDIIEVDIAGHYKDERNKANEDIPHHYTEDMDNPRNRREVVPLYLKSGLQKHCPGVPITIDMTGHTPMFYRPYREWDLPKPVERDSRQQVLEALFQKGSLSPENNGAITRLDKIGFVHLSPEIQEQVPNGIITHPYFFALRLASQNSKNTYAAGLFVNRDLERKISASTIEERWNIIDSSGRVFNADPKMPTLIFLGPQSQTTVSGLFLSSDIPNLVTGDLSLSDALYGLIAMDGPAFFYETPGWKAPTFNELINILKKHESSLLPNIFMLGSNFWIKYGIDYEKQKIIHEALSHDFGKVVGIFYYEESANFFAGEMREAVKSEIRRRFGPVQTEGDFRNGHYIAPGAPYLIQDATAKVVETLREKPDVLAETEKVRKMLKEGVPVSVNVQTGVLEPIKQKIPNKSHKLEYFSSKKSPFSELYFGNTIMEIGNSYKKGIFSEYLGNIIGNKKKSYGLEEIFIDKKHPYKIGGLGEIFSDKKEPYIISELYQKKAYFII